MYIHIDTHLDLDTDILNNIATEVWNWLTTWHCPFVWKLVSDEDMKDEFGDKDELESQLDDIETAIRIIKSNFNID